MWVTIGGIAVAALVGAGAGFSIYRKRRTVTEVEGVPLGQ
jgi:hypothetical protein